jgi:hypothetical protein
MQSPPFLVVAGGLHCSVGGSSAPGNRGRLLEGDGPTSGGTTQAGGVAERERRRRVEGHGGHGRRRGDRGDGSAGDDGGQLRHGLEDELRLERSELLLHLLRHLRHDLTLRLSLRHIGLRRRVLGLGRRRLEPRAEEEVHLVADEGRLVGEVHAELGLRLLQHGGERSLPRTASGAAEDGLNTARDLLVGHHGGSVGKLKSRQNPPSLPRSPASLCLWALGLSLSPLCLFTSLFLSPLGLACLFFLTRAHFVGSGETMGNDKYLDSTRAHTQLVTRLLTVGATAVWTHVSCTRLRCRVWTARLQRARRRMTGMPLQF